VSLKANQHHQYCTIVEREPVHGKCKLKRKMRSTNVSKVLNCRLMPYPYPILDRDLWPKRGCCSTCKNVVCNGRAQKKTLTKILAKFVSRIAKMKSNGPAVEYSCFSTIGCLSRDGPSSEMRCFDHDVVKTCWVGL